MDPLRTLQDIFNSLEEGDFTKSRDAADALQQWLDRGGFAPQLTISSPSRLVDIQLDDAASQVVCSLIFQNVGRLISGAQEAQSLANDPALDRL